MDDTYLQRSEEEHTIRTHSSELVESGQQETRYQKSENRMSNKDLSAQEKTQHKQTSKHKYELMEVRDQLESDITELKEVRDQLKSNNTELQQKIKTLEYKVVKLQREEEQNQKHRESMGRSVKKHCEEIEKFKVEKQKREEKIDAQISSNKEQKLLVQRLSSECESKETRISILEAEYDKIRRELIEVREQNKELLQKDQEKDALHQREVQKLEIAVSHLQRDRERIIKENNGRNVAKDELISKLQKKINKLKEKNKKVKGVVKNMKEKAKQTGKLKENHKKLEEVVMEFQTKIEKELKKMKESDN